MAGGGGVSAPPVRISPLERDTVSIVKKAGWAPGPLCMIAENLIPTGIWSPDRAARNESLYQLSYPGRMLHPPCSLVRTYNLPIHEDAFQP